jgi:hypothetical protein
MTPTESNLDSEKSGRVLVRMPITMHEDLARTAQGEGVSMNQFICGVLAVAIDWRSAYRVERPAADVHQEVTWEMWRDRVRRGDLPKALR